MLKKFLIGTLAVLAVGFALTASAADFGSTTLKVGSKGEAVKALQTLVGATADGSFGPMTKAKVMAWQANNGLTADGLFGKASKAKANAGSTVVTSTGCPAGAAFNSLTGASCTTVAAPAVAGCAAGAAFSATTGAACGTTAVVAGLTGSAGSLTYTLSSALSGESVGEAAVDTQVAGIKVKADAGSDVQLSAVKLVFVKGNSSGTHQKFQYFGKDVSIWLDGVKYGSVSGDTFTSDNSYTATISLSAGAIVRKNTTSNLVVAVSGVPSLDSADAGLSWNVDFKMIRFADAQGAVISEDPGTAVRNFTFDKFASASSLDLKTAVSTDSPKEGIIVGKDSTTFDAPLLKFTLKAKGSDIIVNKIPVLLTSNATTGVMSTQATLSWTGGSDSQDVNGVSTTETVTFGNTSDLGIKITDGNTMTFTVTTKMAKLVAATEGKTMAASVTVASIQSVDQTGADITSTYLTGTASGDTMHMYTVSPTVTVLTEATPIAAVDNGTTASYSALAKIKVQVTANGGTIYLNGANESTSAKQFMQLAVDGGNGSSSIGSVSYNVTGTYTTTNSGADNEYYTLQDGQTMTIEAQALVSQATGSGATLVGMKAGSLLFGTDATSDATRSASIMNWTALTDLLKTGKVSLTK